MGDRAKGGIPARGVEVAFENLGVQVGDPFFLEAMDNTAKYQVRLIGFLPNQSILMTQPVVDGKQILLKSGRSYTVRSTARNRVFAFNANIKVAAIQPYAYLHLDYPREIQALEVRNAARVKVELPVDIRNDNNIDLSGPVEGMMSDLSRTGAFLQSNQKIGREGESIKIRCSLVVADISKQLSLGAIVRSRSLNDPEGSQFRYGFGIQFDGLSEAAQIMLSGFIHEQLLN